MSSTQQLLLGEGAGGAGAAPVYIEEVFSTYLYTGTGASLTITNGIDLSTKGGLVWQKDRSSGGTGHYLQDTVRGVQKYLLSNTSDAEVTNVNTITAFNSTGYTVGGNGNINGSGEAIVSWTFREQPKFFDVVTYTGDGIAGRTVAHNLGSVPGCYIVKRINSTSDWFVYHRSLGASMYLQLNATDSAAANTAFTNGTAPTSSVFSLGTGGAGDANISGGTYVAYLWAHDAGGFGLTGTDNVVSCGTFTANASGNVTVNLGYEPQWLMFKKTSAIDDWVILDTMRNWSYEESAQLKPNVADAENIPLYCTPNATGFTAINGGFNSNATYIYVAIRRGPMKVPTVGTTVFSPNAYTGSGTTTIQTLTTNFPVDAYIQTSRQSSYTEKPFGNRLTGRQKYIPTNSNGVEQTLGSGNGTYNATGFASNTGLGLTGDWNNPSSPNYSPYITWNFRRAPSVFDVVCYVGTSSANQRITHNLTVVPELIITRPRDGSSSWYTYSATIGRSGYLYIAGTAGTTSRSNAWGTSDPTSTDFGVDNTWFGYNGLNVVAYLFATCAGVSKVGSYTGNGSTQTINCGFTGGARFVLIKKSSGTGDWMVADSARGIVSGNDPYLELNNTSAEVTGEDWLDTDSTGFVVNEVSGSNANTSGGTYIFLAFA